MAGTLAPGPAAGRGPGWPLGLQASAASADGRSEAGDQRGREKAPYGGGSRDPTSRQATLLKEVCGRGLLIRAPIGGAHPTGLSSLAARRGTRGGPHTPSATARTRLLVETVCLQTRLAARYGSDGPGLRGCALPSWGSGGQGGHGHCRRLGPRFTTPAVCTPGGDRGRVPPASHNSVVLSFAPNRAHDDGESQTERGRQVDAQVHRKVTASPR